VICPSPPGEGPGEGEQPATAADNEMTPNHFLERMAHPPWMCGGRPARPALADAHRKPRAVRAGAAARAVHARLPSTGGPPSHKSGPSVHESTTADNLDTPQG